MIEHSPQPAIDAGTTQLTAIIQHRRLSHYADPARISHGNAESNVGANSVRSQKRPISGSLAARLRNATSGFTGAYCRHPAD